MGDAIDELRRLYEAGTGGEWFSVGEGRIEIVADADAQPDCEKDGTCVLLDPHKSLGAKQATRDADLTVAMHKHLPALLDVCSKAQAVIDRWDTPLWKDVPATAQYIEELRAAIAALKPNQEGDAR